MEELQEQIEKQLKQLEQEIEESNEKNDIDVCDLLDDELQIGYNLYGMAYNKPIKTSYMGDRIYAQHQLPKKVILNHLHKIFEGTVYSIANLDKEFL